MGYFYWLRVKNSNYLRAEFSLGYLGDAKFYLKSKASFIGISNIASFKLFLIAWSREYCTFSDSSVVNLKSSPWPKYTQLFFIRLFLAKTWKKIGGHRARLREKQNLFRYPELSFREISCVSYMHALMCTLITRQSCAVGMRNTILRNYLNLKVWFRRRASAVILSSLIPEFSSARQKHDVWTGPKGEVRASAKHVRLVTSLKREGPWERERGAFRNSPFPLSFACSYP